MCNYAFGEQPSSALEYVIVCLFNTDQNTRVR